MKRNIFSLSLIAGIAILSILPSCQKVIDLHLKDASGKYVIQGDITDLPGPYQVLISQSGPVGNNYTFNGVSHATVKISDNAGNGETLSEVSPGVYQTVALKGAEGRAYSLSVTIGGQQYTASSTMPARVSLDSLYIRQIYNVSKQVLAVVPVFTDPVQKGNWYRFRQTINGNPDKTLYGLNDDFTNGRVSNWALMRQDPDSTLHLGDHVDVEMQCIDYPVYHYWQSADQSATGQPNSIPANPVTNIVGGALGYFSAHTSQTKSIIVK